MNKKRDKNHRVQTCRGEGRGHGRGSANFPLPLRLNHGSRPFSVSSPLLPFLNCEILRNCVHFPISLASRHLGHHDGAIVDQKTAKNSLRSSKHTTGNTQQVVRFLNVSLDFFFLTLSVTCGMKVSIAKVYIQTSLF